MNRAVLIHAPSALGMAGRLLQKLQENYSATLSSDVNSKELIKTTQLAILIVTDGAFNDNEFNDCIKTAVQHKRRLLVIRDFQVLETVALPNALEEFSSAIKLSSNLVYMAEFFTECISEIEKYLGPSDKVLKALQSDSLVQQITSEQPDLKVGYVSASITLKEFVSALKFYFDYPLDKLNSISIECALEKNDFEYVYSNCKQVKLDINVLKPLEVPTSLWETLTRYPLDIRSLTICYLGDKTTQSLTYLANASPNINSLHLQGCAITNETIKALASRLKNLRTFRISSTKVTEEAINDIAKGFPNLEELQLPSTITSENALELLSRSCRNIKVIQVSSSDISAKGIGYISSNCNIESICLFGSKVTNDVVHSIAKGSYSSIKEIQIHQGSITSDSFKSLSSCNKLESLHLLTCNDIDYVDNVYEEFSKGCSGLRVLNVASSNWSDQITKSICSNLKNLEHVDLTHASVSDSSIEIIASVSQKLKILRVGSTSNITGTSFGYLSAHCNELETLIVTMTSITDESLANLPSSLTELDIGSCKLITDIGIDNVTRSCPNLRVFSSYDSPKITPDNIRTVINRLKNIDTITIDTTVSVYEQILQSCSTLSCIKLRGFGRTGRFDLNGLLQKLKIEFVMDGSAWKLFRNAISDEARENIRKHERDSSERRDLKHLNVLTIDQDNDENINIPAIPDKIGDEISGCILYHSSTGKVQAYHLYDQLSKLGYTLICIPCDQNHDDHKIRSIITSSHKVIALLTFQFLQLPTSEKLLQFSVGLGKRVILVHDPAKGYRFPGPDEQPESLKQAELFDDKAVTYMKQYLPSTVSQIARKLSGGKITKENVETRCFLSHRRSSGQGTAGRLYDALKKAGYNCFLDTEAMFDLHNLEKLVEHTRVFIFILTADILSSFWCLQELRSAIKNNRKILIVRDINFTIPSVFPPELEDIRDVIVKSPSIDYNPDSIQTCVSKIIEELGPNDKVIQQLQENEHFQKTILTPEKHLQVQIVSNISIRDIIHSLAKYYNYPVNDIKSLNLFCSLSQSCFEILRKYCPNLESINLTVENSDQVDDSRLKDSYLLHSLVMFRTAKLVTDLGIRHIMNNNPDLEVLSISGSSFSNDALSLLFQRCNKLKSVATGSSIVDSAIESLAVNCQNLQVLDLSYGELITDISLQKLGEHSKNLKSITLDSCFKVTSSGMISLLNGCNKLEYINIRNSDFLTLETYRTMFHNLTNLTTLIFLNNSIVSDDMITVLGEGNKKFKLETAKFGMCNDLTFNDQSIRLLKDHCTLLKTLHVSKSIPNENLEKLKIELPNTTIQKSQF